MPWKLEQQVGCSAAELLKIVLAGIETTLSDIDSYAGRATETPTHSHQVLIIQGLNLQRGYWWWETEVIWCSPGVRFLSLVLIHLRWKASRVQVPILSVMTAVAHRVVTESEGEDRARSAGRCNKWTAGPSCPSFHVSSPVVFRVSGSRLIWKGRL